MTCKEKDRPNRKQDSVGDHSRRRGLTLWRMIKLFSLRLRRGLRKLPARFHTGEKSFNMTNEAPFLVSLSLQASILFLSECATVLLAVASLNSDIRLVLFTPASRACPLSIIGCSLILL